MKHLPSFNITHENLLVNRVTMMPTEVPTYTKDNLCFLACILH